MRARRRTPGRARQRHGERHRAGPPESGILDTLRWRASRNPAITVTVLIVIHLLLSLLTFQPQPHTGGDNAAYIALGRSLLERGQYLSLYDPATPPHTQYPPVFPAVLAIAMAAGLEPWVPLKVIVSLFSAAAVGLTYLWIRRRRRPMLALGAGLVLAASPGVLDLGHWILSDVPFWCFTMLSLWAFERLRPEVRGRFAAAVVATVLAYFTRSAGLPLLVAAFGWLVLRRRWRQVGVLAAVALPLAAAWYLRARMQGGVDYVGQFWFVNPYSPELGRIDAAGLLDRALENASKYVRIHLPILLTGTTGALPLTAGIATTALAAFGWTTRLRRPALAELFLPLYLGLLLIWPAVWSGERFLLPALPLLLYYAGDGLARGFRRVRPSVVIPAGAAATGLVVLLGLPTTILAAHASGRCMLDYRIGNRYPCLPPTWREFLDVAERARASLPRDAVVISRKPRLFWAVSGLKGRVYPFSAAPADLFRAAEEAGARYIVLDNLDGLSPRYLIPAVLGRPQALCMMHPAPGGTSLLGIVPGAAAMPDRPMSGADVSVPRCTPDFWREDARPRPASQPPPDTVLRDTAAISDTTARSR